MTGNGRGSIRNLQRYKQAKLLDHSDWDGRLRDGITPSDIDMTWDNSGKIIYAELSSSCIEWHQIETGQRWLYQSAIKDSWHCACLCKHSVPDTGLINSFRDVDCFQIMIWRDGFLLSQVLNGLRWPGFVETWVNTRDGPMRFRRWLVSNTAPLVPAQQPINSMVLR